MKPARGSYTFEENNCGCEIYYEDELVPKFLVVGKLSRKDAEEWSKRLNLAYTFGSSNALDVIR